MEDCFTREQIKKALALRYRTAFGDYERLALTAKELAHEGDRAAYEIMNRRALLREQVLAGITAAAESLGISDDEFMTAVNQDRNS